MSLAKNIEFLRRFQKMNGLAGLQGAGWSGQPGATQSALVETVGFGANPGQLRMFSLVPDSDASIPLVVVLHGCKQNAAGYEVGAGWATLAQRYGFALLMPEQQASNNPNGCFNWFSPEDTTRGSGEAASIRQMIERIATDHKIDRRRIFVTGLSAGGAMTAVMLATYPEVFAGGAIIAGLPYGVANSVQQALQAMMQAQPRSGRELGDLVRKASPHKGPWPKLSVWHGSADRTVNPSNADAIVRQWLDLHQLPAAPMAQGVVDGHPRQVWWNADGETLVESYTITSMAHGTPLGVAANDERYGVEGAFMLEAGISSSYHIAQFFGLTGATRRPATQQPAVPAAQALLAPEAVQLEKIAPEPLRARKPNRRFEPSDTAGRRSIDVGAIINRALTAAGLLK